MTEEQEKTPAEKGAETRAKNKAAEEAAEKADEMYATFGVSPVEPTEIEVLADEVLQGEHGRGDARKKSLGKKYKDVMTEVVRIRRQNGTKNQNF